MVIIYFFYGLCFGGLGLATSLQIRRGGEFPLAKHLPWLAAFAFSAAASGWVEMFLVSETNPEVKHVLQILSMILQPLTGIFLLIFGWRILTKLTALHPLLIFIPGILIVPIAYAITFAATTFVTPSPIDIPVDIWSRYLLYLPGSILAGIAFLRQWHIQKKAGYIDVSRLMLGAGLAFLFEAFVVGLVVPAAPYGPASYYNYDRTVNNAFLVEQSSSNVAFGLNAWLDYERVLEATGLPIQFWRLLSAIIVVYFIVRSLDVFEAIRKRRLVQLEAERDLAERSLLANQMSARETAEHWSEALVNISKRIVDMDNMDQILLYILENTRALLLSDYIAIAFFNEQSKSLELKYTACQSQSQALNQTRVVTHPLIQNTFNQSKSFLAGEFSALENPEQLYPFEIGKAQQAAFIPIRLDTHPFGVMWIARQNSNYYTETDLIWLECMADQVVIAVKHGLMTAQLQSLSVVEERGRIAREMHDGLAQVLGYLNLQVQTLDALRKKGNWEKLELEMQNMRQAVQQAQADVRENILSLRTTLANESGLVPAMIEYLEQFGIQTGIDVSFNNLVGEELSLSSLADVQLVCILQEALTNVRKHAYAQKVTVQVSRIEHDNQNAIYMTIKDDGVGFTKEAGKRSFGLQTMSERAQSVGGLLAVNSALGQGTSIECRLPCLPQNHISPGQLQSGFPPGERIAANQQESQAL